MRAFVNESRAQANQGVLATCDTAFFHRIIELWAQFNTFWSDVDTSATPSVRVNLCAIRLVILYAQRACHWLAAAEITDDQLTQAANDLARASLCFIQFHQHQRDISYHLRMPRSNQSRVKEDQSILVTLKSEQDKAVAQWQTMCKVISWEQVWALAPLSIADALVLIEQCDVNALKIKRDQTLERKREGRKKRERRRQIQEPSKKRRVESEGET
jgi:hypothetical protein